MKFLKNGCVLVILIIVVFVVVISVLVKLILPESSSNDGREYAGYFKKTIISGYEAKNQILLIPIHGVISRTSSGSGVFGGDGVVDCDLVIAMLDQAIYDTDIKAVVFDLNTPGGEVVATDLIYRKILELRNRRQIPIIGSMSVMAASGGYYLAAGMDQIVAHPLCTTGSIGVIIQSYKYYGLQEKIGIQSESYTSGVHKDILSGSRPTSEEEKKIIEAHLANVYDYFATIVAIGRELEIDKVKAPPIGDGRVMLGMEAKELGLVDVLGDLDDAIKLARMLSKLSDEAEVVVFNQSQTLGALLKKIIGAQANSTKTKIDLALPGVAKYAQYPGRYYLIAE